MCSDFVFSGNLLVHISYIIILQPRPWRIFSLEEGEKEALKFSTLLEVDHISLNHIEPRLDRSQS